MFHANQSPENLEKNLSEEQCNSSRKPTRSPATCPVRGGPEAVREAVTRWAPHPVTNGVKWAGPNIFNKSCLDVSLTGAVWMYCGCETWLMQKLAESETSIQALNHTQLPSHIFLEPQVCTWSVKSGKSSNLCTLAESRRPFSTLARRKGIGSSLGRPLLSQGRLLDAFWHPFVLKITTFCAPAIYPDFSKYCACHEKSHSKITKCCTCQEEWTSDITKYCTCHEKWHCDFTGLLLGWTVITLLSCYFTVTLLSCYLSCYFTELLLYCYFTELLLYWGVVTLLDSLHF